jgi:hypothetical protein
MSLSHLRIPHVVFHSCNPTHTRIEFYREEFLKVRASLEHQREYFSEQAIPNVECALTRILGELEHLTNRQDADDIVEAWPGSSAASRAPTRGAIHARFTGAGARHLRVQPALLTDSHASPGDPGDAPRRRHARHPRGGIDDGQRTCVALTMMSDRPVECSIRPLREISARRSSAGLPTGSASG